MKNFVLALFVLWFLSLNFYLPITVGIVLGAAFATVAAFALAQKLARRGEPVDHDGSLGL